MSDFEDEPQTGRAASDGDPGTAPQGGSPADDDWDAEPAPPKKPAARQSDDDWDDDWDEDDRPKRDLTLVYAVVAAAIVIVLAVVLTRNDDTGTTTATPPAESPPATEAPAGPTKNWQGPVGDAVGDQGSEAQARVESGTGVYVWTDFWGWHVRANGSEEVVVTVTAPKVRAKDTDDYDDDNEDNGTEFTTEVQVTLPPGDGTTGAGFDLGDSETATITVSRGGQNVPPADIKLGGADGVASENPVTFTKS